MKTLILTCNTGEGHNSSAAAIKEVFEENGEHCDLRDSLRFSSGGLSGFIAFGHVCLYRHMPWLFNKGYNVTEKNGSYFKKGSLIYKILSSGTKNLYKYIVSNNIDNIICVHPFSALLVTEMRSKFNVDIPASIVATDYTCVPCTSDSDMDRYFIPHESLVDEFVNCGIPEEKILVSGIPVRKRFFGVNTKDNARNTLGLPKERKIVLICCGSMGCGPMKSISAELRNSSDDNSLTIVVCGNNKKLYNKLIKYQSEKFYVVGYTDKMYEYMQACDIFVTKPGGVSTTESLTLSKPMVFINAVGGCEQRNYDFFAKFEYVVTTESNDSISKAAIELLNDFERRNELSMKIKNEFGRKNGAEFVFSTLSKTKENNCK